MATEFAGVSFGFSSHVVSGGRRRGKFSHARTLTLTIYELFLEFPRDSDDFVI